MQALCKALGTETEKEIELLYAKTFFYCGAKNMQDFLLELQKSL